MRYARKSSFDMQGIFYTNTQRNLLHVSIQYHFYRNKTKVQIYFPDSYNRLK